jgi:hypothetical protein
VKASENTRAQDDDEIYAANGTRMLQQVYDNQTFTAGQPRQYTLSWAIPAGTPNGTYSIKIGTFSPGWGTFYAWNDNAATVTVAR